MEVILGAGDLGADEAERYGWINRALPDAELDAFVAELARRIASFPADAVRSTKQALDALTLPGADAIRADARRCQQLVQSTGPPHVTQLETSDRRAASRTLPEVMSQTVRLPGLRFRRASASSDRAVGASGRQR